MYSPFIFRPISAPRISARSSSSGRKGKLRNTSPGRSLAKGRLQAVRPEAPGHPDVSKASPVLRISHKASSDKPKSTIRPSSPNPPAIHGRQIVIDQVPRDLNAPVLIQGRGRAVGQSRTVFRVKGKQVRESAHLSRSGDNTGHFPFRFRPGPTIRCVPAMSGPKTSTACSKIRQ